MPTLTVTDARKNLFGPVDEVADEHRGYCIVGKRNQVLESERTVKGPISTLSRELAVAAPDPYEQIARTARPTPARPSPAMSPAEKRVPRSVNRGKILSAAARRQPPMKIVVLSRTGR